MIECAEPDWLVAVNGAFVSTYNVDFWAMIDWEVFYTIAHDFQHAIAAQKQFKDVVLWIPERWFDFIKTSSPIFPAFYDFKKETFLSVPAEEFAKAMPFGRNFPWMERTMFVAVGMAILRGAREIKIYGADLGGEGYHLPGLENCRTRHTHKRWVEEKIWFNQLKNICADYNITLIREGE